MADSEVYVGFSTTDYPLSIVIRKLTRSTVSHAWLRYFDETLGRDMVFEAGFSGVTATPYDHFAKKHRVVKVCKPIIPLGGALKEASQYLDDSYDYDGLLGTSLVLIGRWLKRKFHNPFHGPHEMFCSQLVTVVLQLAKYPGALDLIPQDTTPSDLFMLF